MLSLRLDASDIGPLRLLCLGAHCDDIEIGCGGTVLRLLELSDRLEVYWLVFSSNPARAREAQASAQGMRHCYLHAQEYVKAFYAAHGYREHGLVFLDAGIRHIEMRKEL